MNTTPLTISPDGARRYSADTEEWIDRSFKRESGPFMRLLLFLFSRSFNAFVKCLIGRAYERGLVSSKSFHEMAAMCDRMLQGQCKEPDNQGPTFL